MSEQVYKKLFRDEDGRYFFAFDDDTKLVVDQQSYIMIYILELLQKRLEKEEEKEMLSKEKENE